MPSVAVLRRTCHGAARAPAAHSAPSPGPATVAVAWRRPRAWRRLAHRRIARLGPGRYVGGVDLRTRTSLFCGALALAIAVSIMLRGRPRRAQIFFAAFAGNVGLWYLAQWLYQWNGDALWSRVTAVLAVVMPQFAVSLFEAMVPRDDRRPVLMRVAGLLMVPMLVLALTRHDNPWVRAVIFLYVCGVLGAGLWYLALRGHRSPSRANRRRIQLLATIGAAAVAFTLGDFLWFIGAPLPPVGAVLSVVFLFALAESLSRDRLVDLYDILGHLLVSTALAFLLAGIFYVFVVLFGGFETMYLGAILAAIVILVLFVPLREKVESYTQRVFFRERFDLERAVSAARAHLVHVLRVEEMVQVALGALEDSHRATGAALYLRDPNSGSLLLQGAFGPEPPARVEEAAAHALLDLLSRRPSVVLEEVAFELQEQRRRGWSQQAEASERILAGAEVLGSYRMAVCVAIHGSDSEMQIGRASCRERVCYVV
mgnify:CR=1 FL=1